MDDRAGDIPRQEQNKNEPARDRTGGAGPFPDRPPGRVIAAPPLSNGGGHAASRRCVLSFYAANFSVARRTRGITNPLINSIERSTLRVSKPPIRVQHSNSLKPYSSISADSFSVQ